MERNKTNMNMNNITNLSRAGKRQLIVIDFLRVVRSQKQRLMYIEISYDELTLKFEVTFPALMYQCNSLNAKIT